MYAVPKDDEFVALLRRVLAAHAHDAPHVVREAVETASGVGADVWSDEDSVRLLQRNWIGAAQTKGCRFASSLALSMPESAWPSRCYWGPTSTAIPRFVADLNDHVGGDAELFSGIFPDVSGEEQLADLLRVAATEAEIEVEAALPWGAVTTISASYAINSNCRAWIMCFSDAGCLPNTRKSPFTELVVRTSPEKFFGSHSAEADADVAVYVADTPTDFDAPEWNALWAGTERNVSRYQRFDNGHYTAARVSCILPTTTWFGHGYEVDAIADLAERLARWQPLDTEFPTTDWTPPEHWKTEIAQDLDAE